MRRAGPFARVLMAGCLVFILAGCTTAAPDDDDDSSSAPGAATLAAQEEPTSGGTGGWLADIPANVPKFEQGKMKDDSGKIDFKSRTVWSLYYSGVQRDYVQGYFDKLKAAGLTVTVETDRPDAVSGFAKMKQGSDELIVSSKWADGGDAQVEVQIVKP